MAEISRTSLINDLWAYLAQPASGRAVYNSGNCPTYVNRNIGGIDPIGPATVTNTTVNIPDQDTVSVDDIVRHAAQQALYCTVVRLANYGIYESRNAPRTIRNDNGSWYTIPAGQMRLLYGGSAYFRMHNNYATHTPGNEVGIAPYGPATGKNISQAEVRNYYAALANNSAKSLGSQYTVDLTMCHSSCHDSCHGSRGRR